MGEWVSSIGQNEIHGEMGQFDEREHPVLMCRAAGSTDGDEHTDDADIPVHMITQMHTTVHISLTFTLYFTCIPLNITRHDNAAESEYSDDDPARTS